MPNRFQEELNSLKRIGYFNPHNLSQEEISNLPIRYGTRTVVLTKEGDVVLINVSKGKYLTLVGGSIEEGESIEEGMVRECKEESGYDVSVISKLGYIELCRLKYRRFVFGFLVKTVGCASPLSLTEEEKELGHAVHIFPMDKAIATLKNDIDKDIYLKDNLAALRSLLFLEEGKKYLKNKEKIGTL